jgi:adenine-specific DNA-methyltransferase
MKIRRKIIVSKVKKSGEVFTPNSLVIKMLDLINYEGKKILGKIIMENSFGQGAFLDVIIERYKKALIESGITDEKEIEKELSDHVYGIELDVNNFNIVKNKYPFLKNIFNEDTLFANTSTMPKFDFIVGNPPYVRVHNLKNDYKEKLKEKYETAFGTYDLYYLFYEWSINMIKENGVIQFITPTGFTNNSSGKVLRELIDKKELWHSFLDLSDYNLFSGISTYTGIVTLKKREIAPWLKDFEKFVVKNGKFQSGLATNCDPIFIREKGFFSDEIKKEGLIKKSFKCSSKEYGEILWPYINSTLISEEILKENYKNTYKYLEENKNILLDRSLKDAEWYQFARSQGIKDMLVKKLAISLLNPKGKIEFVEVDENTAVYQGVFFTGNLEEAKTLLTNEKFISVVESFGTKRQNDYIQLTAGVFNKVLEKD